MSRPRGDSNGSPSGSDAGGAPLSGLTDALKAAIQRIDNQVLLFIIAIVTLLVILAAITGHLTEPEFIVACVVIAGLTITGILRSGRPQDGPRAGGPVVDRPAPEVATNTFHQDLARHDVAGPDPLFVRNDSRDARPAADVSAVTNVDREASAAGDGADRLVSVEASRLRDLRDVQQKLHVYISGFIASSVVSKMLAGILEDIETAGGLPKSADRLRDSLNIVRLDGAAVVSVPDCEATAEFDDTMRAVRTLWDEKLGSGDLSRTGADLPDAVREFADAIERMEILVDEIALRCRTATPENLTLLKNTVESIWDNWAGAPRRPRGQKREVRPDQRKVEAAAVGAENSGRGKRRIAPDDLKVEQRGSLA